MTRIEVACYSLIASAFVLAAVLMMTLEPRLNSVAQADMVIARDNFTLMTAQTRSGEESLFVLDNSNDRLLVYNLNAGRKTLELVTNMALNDIFSNAGGGRGR